MRNSPYLSVLDSILGSSLALCAFVSEPYLFRHTGWYLMKGFILESLNDNRGIGSPRSRLDSGVREFVGLGAFGVNSLTLRCLVCILPGLSRCSVLRLITLFVRLFGSGDSVVASKSVSSVLIGFALFIEIKYYPTINTIDSQVICPRTMGFFSVPLMLRIYK
jgi:hypothetical protein